jgi:hypothetical protein
VVVVEDRDGAARTRGGHHPSKRRRRAGQPLKTRAALTRSYRARCSAGSAVTSATRKLSPGGLPALCARDQVCVHVDSHDIAGGRHRGGDVAGDRTAPTADVEDRHLGRALSPDGSGHANTANEAYRLSRDARCSPAIQETQKSADVQGFCGLELGGFEPPTSLVDPRRRNLGCRFRRPSLAGN